MQLDRLLKEAQIKLQAHSSSAAVEVRLILAYLLNTKPEAILLLEEEIPRDACTELMQHIEARCQGVPLDYIIHQAEFWKYRFQVEKHSLAPREETQVIIETMLKLYPSSDELQIADIGCGSGVIAISIALEFPNSHIWASDIDERNIALCRKNAQSLGATNLKYQTTDLLEGYPGQFDVILSNPPYVESHLLEGLHDPKLALDGGKDGLEIITRLIQQSVSYLKKKGKIILEHGNQQAPRVSDLLDKYGFCSITTLPDMFSQPRITYATLK